VAGPQGLEPRQAVPKTAVLPLHHGPTSSNKVYFFLWVKKKIREIPSHNALYSFGEKYFCKAMNFGNIVPLRNKLQSLSIFSNLLAFID